jgi:predicted RNase H-like HicB family nuclease
LWPLHSQQEHGRQCVDAFRPTARGEDVGVNRPRDHSAMMRRARAFIRCSSCLRLARMLPSCRLLRSPRYNAYEAAAVVDRHASAGLAMTVAVEQRSGQGRGGNTMPPTYHFNLFYSEEDGGWIADIPDLALCSAFGETTQDALSEVLAAQDAWLDVARKRGRPIPPARYRPAVHRTA